MGAILGHSLQDEFASVMRLSGHLSVGLVAATIIALPVRAQIELVPAFPNVTFSVSRRDAS
jgi:hypothetical protein